MLWRCGLRSVHYCIAIALYSDGPMVNQCSEQWRPSSRGRILTPRYMAVSFAVFIRTFVRAYRKRIQIYWSKKAVSKIIVRIFIDTVQIIRLIRNPTRYHTTKITY